MVRPAAAALLACLAGVAPDAGLLARAHAEPMVLRYASMSPEGTAWTRELKAYAREVRTLSNEQVQVKLYLGGIAGDELAVLERIRKGQLDGELAAVTCERLAPSLKVLRVAGLIRGRDEARYVIDRLRPTLEAETRRSGFTLLGMTWFGSDIILSRTPVRTFDDLRRLRFWIWDLDQVWARELPLVGLHVVPAPVADAAAAFESGRVDGFLALPNAALAYQWSAESAYFTRLPISAMAGCNVIANAAFDGLPFSSQTALRQASAKLNFRFFDVNAAQEDALLDRLFARQGVKPVPVTELLRLSFLEAARRAREHLPDALVPQALITQVQAWLSDYRAAR
jgi:TRAP-type C4-dicarboxylate transport system substrate-binding protein